MQGKRHEPTDATRRAVQAHALVGTPQEVISDILQIDGKTLRKHYRVELDHSIAKANAAIGGTLFAKAKGGDVASMIFWLKTRAGWKETQRIEGDIGVNVTDDRSPDEIRDSILGKLAAMSAASGPKEIS
jgi:hypothetical protein